MIQSEADPAEPVAQRVTRVLIVDDDAEIRQILDTILSHEGYRTMLAENGYQALEQVSEAVPDLILLDVMMPDKDGYETCREIRQYLKEQHVPIIMLTALNDMEAIEKTFLAGATDFLSKPFTIPLLVQRIRFFLRSRDIYREWQKTRQKIINAQRIARLGYLEFDAHSERYYISGEGLQLFGLSSDKSIDRSSLLSFIDESDRERVERSLIDAEKNMQPFSLDCKIIDTYNIERTVYLHGDIDYEQESSGHYFTAIIQDISERKRAEETVEYQRTHDILTTLPNRNSYTGSVQHYLFDGKENQFSIILLRIDRFLNISKSLGHIFSDRLIIEIAERLSSIRNENIELSRTENDQFGIVALGYTSEEDIIELTSSIRQLFKQPFIIEKYELYVTASIGVVSDFFNASSANELLKNANAALGRAIQNGGDCTEFYSIQMNQHAARQLKLETELRHAIERDEIRVYYQPKVHARTRHIVGMEALVRWHHAENGIISPLDFISIAEQTGLIVDIGRYVLEQTCKQTIAWHQMGYPLKASVNLSPRQFLYTDLMKDIEYALSSTGLPTEYLDLEITESVAMENFEKSLAILQLINEMGISISLDDFGTGYSSLSYLQRLPINTLKIDRSFIKDIDEYGNHSTFARTITTMAQNLELSTVAEGIEHEYQYHLLNSFGCDELQGYLFSPPVPGEEFTLLLQKPGV